MPIPPLRRAISHIFTFIIARAILLLLGFFWISVEQVTRKKGCVLVHSTHLLLSTSIGFKERSTTAFAMVSTSWRYYRVQLGFMDRIAMARLSVRRHGVGH
jgi:hypothetical protein